MIMAAASFLKENPNPTEAEVREALEGNLCRCTGYQNIVTSILDAAGRMAGVGVDPAADLNLGALPFVWPITEDIKVPVHHPLTGDTIRFHGDAVAVVVA